MHHLFDELRAHKPIRNVHAEMERSKLSPTLFVHAQIGRQQRKNSEGNNGEPGSSSIDQAGG
eukprot:1097702-Pleurochrysis_carterae.AAC.17